MKESRSERFYISLKPSTAAKVERLAKASGKPFATVISDLVEEAESLLDVGASALEKINASREKSLRRHGRLAAKLTEGSKC